MSKHEPAPWTIRDLAGKYYGTIIDIGMSEVTLWDHGEFSPPSVRELPEGKSWDDLDREAQWELTCDSHYENERDYATALVLAAAPDMLKELVDWMEWAAKYRADIYRDLKSDDALLLFETLVAQTMDTLAKARGEDDA